MAASSLACHRPRKRASSNRRPRGDHKRSRITGSPAFADDDIRIGAGPIAHDPLPPHPSRSRGRARRSSSSPTRGSSRSPRRPAPSTCAGARRALPACAPSSAGSSCRPRARRRSATGCSPPSIRSITTRCAARAPTSSSGWACRRRRSNRSGRSARRVAKGHIDLDACRQSWTPTARMPRSPRCTASARGPPIFISCSASAMPTRFPPAISPCRRPRASPSGCASGRTPRRLTKMAEAWRPWRGVAAHLLWAYYHAVKKRDVVPVQPQAERPKAKAESEEKEKAKWLNSTARASSRAQGIAKQLVVFLHGYGADGNDLIEIGRAWQGLLPDAAFVSPHAPRPCGQAPMRARMVSADVPRSERALGRRASRGAGAQRFPRRRTGAPAIAAAGLGAGRLFARAP